LKVKIPELISAGLILSYRCTAECRHCMYACTPKWEDRWISQKDLEEILSRLAGKIKPSPWGKDAVSLNYGLHFTGGEPFLNFELLVKAQEIAEELGIPSTFVETNCYWCRDDNVTREKLKLLKNKGLKGILISVNPFYTEYIPFERTERCIRISKEIFGENVMVYQVEYYHQFKKLRIKGRISLKDYIKIVGKRGLTEKVELFLMGRAAYRLKELYPLWPAENFFEEPCIPSFLRSWHNHFDNYGNFVPGYCGGISLGNWHKLDSLIEEGIDVGRHPVLKFLIKEDMKGLFQFAKEKGYRKKEEGYLSKCHLCLDIRKYLVSKENLEELAPSEFYEYL